ncbi:MAG: hypothetical protein L0323_05030 [Planctomycetes bacterium]|nr:hypothetical protein [Planctomycetota bacterium]
MRLIAWIVAAGVLAPAALAFPTQEGQAEKQEGQGEKKEEKPEAKPERPGEGRGGAPAFEAKDYEELGAYSDSLAAAELDDETTGELLVAEVRGKMMRGRGRGPGGGAGPGAGAGPGDSPPGQSGGARPEPLSTFVKAKLAEGKKGAELAQLVKAEIEKRRSDMPGGGGYGAGGGRNPERQKAMREAVTGIVKKLRGEKLKGKAFAEAFVKEQRAQVEKAREERSKEREKGENPEKPRDGA